MDILWDKQELARNLANLTGIVKTDECGGCHHEFPLGELFPYDGKDMCEDCLKEAEDEDLCPVCGEIPLANGFCSADHERIFYDEKTRAETAKIKEG